MKPGSSVQAWICLECSPRCWQTSDGGLFACFLFAHPNRHKHPPKQPSCNHSVPLEAKRHGVEGSFSLLHHFMHHGVWLLCCMLPSSLTASLLTVRGLSPPSVCCCYPSWILRRKMPCPSRYPLGKKILVFLNEGLKNDPRNRAGPTTFIFNLRTYHSRNMFPLTLPARAGVHSPVWKLFFIRLH